MGFSRWLILSALLMFLFLADLSIGSADISLLDLLSILSGGEGKEAAWKDIIWDFRMTKSITCVVAGGALAVSGLQMQTLFRNALAGPDVLGLSSGASLAVALLILGQSAGLRLLGVGGSWTLVFASSIGCLGVFLIMLLIANRLRDNASLLLIGLMIGAGTSSIVSVLQYFSKAEELQMFIIWTFGSIGSLSWSEIKVLSVVLFIGTLIGIFSSKALNAWLLGENYARSMGIPVARTRLLIILGTSILTGAVTAFCGPIAFVGLAVPHLVKVLIRSSNHITLIPAVIMGGACLMLLCDILTNLPGKSQLLPINAITALVGAPVVIWVILKNKRVNV